MSNPLARTVMELKKIAKQIDTQTRYGKWSKDGEGPKGSHEKQIACSWYWWVTNQKGNQNAANVRFCIPFNKLFTVSVTQGRCMWAKRSATGKEWKESKGEPGAHFIDLFYSIWTKEWEKKQGSHLRTSLPASCQYILPRQDSWHFCTFEGEKSRYKHVSLSKEKLIRCQKLLNLVTNTLRRNGKCLLDLLIPLWLLITELGSNKQTKSHFWSACCCCEKSWLFYDLKWISNLLQVSTIKMLATAGGVFRYFQFVSASTEETDERIRQKKVCKRTQWNNSSSAQMA